MDSRLVRAFLKPMEPEPTRMKVEGDLHPPIKCLLCDIYGTLLISGSGDIGVAREQAPEEEALASLVKECGIPQSPEMLRRSLFEAIEKDHHLKKADGIEHPEVEIDKIWSSILPFDEMETIRSFAVKWEMVVNPVWPMPGLTRLLEACHNDGIALGIISNAQFFTPLLFEWLLGSDLEHLGFDRRLILLSYQHNRAKPSDVLFATAADRLRTMGISPAQTAFIGNDMLNDIAPAHRAGFQTILFAGDARSLRMRENDPVCRDIKPDMQVTQLLQLASGLAKPSSIT